MKTIAIIALVAAAATVYMMTSSETSALESQFGAFMTEYRKSYNSEAEYKFRMEVFRKNLESAKIQQALNPLAEFGVTVFSDQTEQEMKARMGLFEIPVDPSVPVYTQTSSETNDIDWRGKVPAIQNQGSCGSCWAFSATAALEGRYAIKTGQLYKFSEQQAVDCTSAQYGCNGGWMHDVFGYLRTKAFIQGSQYPYKAVKGACRDTQFQGVTKTSGYQFVSANEDTHFSALGQGPISIALDASTWSSYRGGIVTSCGTGMNHGVVLIGYAGNGNAWTVRNSWGTSWGEAGHIRLQRGRNMCNMTYKSSIPTF
jgi:C1A family cysteine protease